MLVEGLDSELPFPRLGVLLSLGEGDIPFCSRVYVLSYHKQPQPEFELSSLIPFSVPIAIKHSYIR